MHSSKKKFPKQMGITGIAYQRMSAMTKRKLRLPIFQIFKIELTERRARKKQIVIKLARDPAPRICKYCRQSLPSTRTKRCLANSLKDRWFTTEGGHSVVSCLATVSVALARQCCSSRQEKTPQNAVMLILLVRYGQ